MLLRRNVWRVFFSAFTERSDDGLGIFTLMAAVATRYVPSGLLNVGEPSGIGDENLPNLCFFVRPGQSSCNCISS